MAVSFLEAEVANFLRIRGAEEKKDVSLWRVKEWIGNLRVQIN